MSRRSKAARKGSNRPAAVRRPVASAAPELADVEAPVAPSPAAVGIAGNGDEEGATGSAAVGSAAAPGPVRRGVGRVEPAAAARRRERAARPGSLAAGFEPLDPGDPAIPYSRVPYVPADLRRVAIIAGAMILLILLADIIVTHAVK